MNNSNLNELFKNSYNKSFKNKNIRNKNRLLGLNISVKGRIGKNDRSRSIK